MSDDLQSLYDETQSLLANVVNREEAIIDVTAMARSLAERGAIEADEMVELNKSLRGVLAMLRKDRIELRQFRLKIVDALREHRRAMEADARDKLDDWWRGDGAAPPYATNDEE